ncbi:DinB family protein [Salibacter halophilus]|jgi:hypothetical protein|uniref:DinB family protein n=2 Tax=Salibacter halophilus TaxID=1803916 RepID=A0A6N6M767_9FLAO|nr:DinB family protein [Salibacter halophilus]
MVTAVNKKVEICSMKMDRAILLNELAQQTRNVIGDVKEFKLMEDEKLNFKENPDSWSVLECIAHLVKFGELYIREFEKSISKADDAPGSDQFKSGFFGDLFAKKMQPGETKMKAPKSMQPAESNVNRDVLDKFLVQQEKWLSLIDAARSKDLNKIKVRLSIAQFVKFKLGDMFRVIVNHNRRHVEQGKRALNAA